MRSLLLLALLPVSLHAAPLDEFRDRARPELLVPFTRDLGGLLGAAGFSDGRALGFPGFEVGLLAIAQSKPDPANGILRSGGVDGFGLPLAQIAVGLPWHVDLVAHGFKTNDIGVMGAGVRYGILKSGMLTKFVPNIGVSAFADKVDHDYFNVRHYGANLNVGWDLPIVKPYLGVGADWTRLRAEAATSAGVVGQTAWSRDARLTVGANVVPFPFLRLKVAYLNLHGQSGGELGLSFKF